MKLFNSIPFDVRFSDIIASHEMRASLLATHEFPRQCPVDQVLWFWNEIEQY